MRSINRSTGHLGPDWLWCEFPDRPTWIAGLRPFLAHQGLLRFQRRGQAEPRWVRTRPVTYLQHRLLVEAARMGGDVDARLAAFVPALLEDITNAPEHVAPPPNLDFALLEVILQAKKIVVRHQMAPLRLARMARAVGCSVFVLCRAFRALEGRTIMSLHRDLRLRAALTALTEHRGDITRVAMDFGFSSHSHFTAAFSSYFGATPSSVADLLAPRERPAKRRA